MSDTHNKLQYQYGNNYNHWKIMDVDVDLNYFSFSSPIQTLTQHTYLNPEP